MHLGKISFDQPGSPIPAWWEGMYAAHYEAEM